jgi:serine protease inhibitor
MIRQLFPIVSILIVLVALYTSCNEDSATPEGSSDYQPLDGREVTEAMLADAQETFGLDALKAAVALEDPGKNVSISPLSLSAALYMVYNGARGDTKEAMESALRLEVGLDPAQLNAAYANLLSMLAPDHSAVELQTAHAVYWDQNRITPHDEFLQAMQETFDADQQPMSFAENGAVDIINDWVNEKTNGRIEKVIDQLDPQEVMFILNALYLKADWLLSFPEELTGTSEFYLRDGSTTPVDMMFHDREASHMMGANYTAVELPFKDEAYAMTFIMPTGPAAPDDFVEALNPDVLAEIDAGMHSSHIYLYLPSFEVDYKAQASQMLKNMGMSIAFDQAKADLRNLGQAPEGNLYINRVVHKTYLKIDERGAEGAAVTGVGIGVTSVPPSIKFDRPFVYLLRHIPTKTIVFAGVVANPSAD